MSHLLKELHRLLLTGWASFALCNTVGHYLTLAMISGAEAMRFVECSPFAAGAPQYMPVM
jgi:hypothetical protein